MKKYAFILAVISIFAVLGWWGQNADLKPVSESPHIEVYLNRFSGRQNPSFAIQNAEEAVQLAQFFRDLPRLQELPTEPVPSNTFILVNTGIPGIPSYAEVYSGIIELPGPLYYRDARNLAGWLLERLNASLGLDEQQPVLAAAYDQPLGPPIPFGSMPLSGSEPRYEPEQWNIPDPLPLIEKEILDFIERQTKNNCYNYACNKKTGTLALPGRGSLVDDNPTNDYTPPHGWNEVDVNGDGVIGSDERTWFPEDLVCENVKRAAIADGLVVSDCDVACEEGSYKKALVVAPKKDFHWYRQDDTGRWSHKRGNLRASDRDASGHLIDDPRSADRDYESVGGANYTEFCGCFCCGINVTKI